MLYADGIHDDTLALQALLDGRGIVTVEKPGIYLISKTLKIYSNTRFVLSPGATLLAAPMSRCALLENAHFAQGQRDENIEIVGGIWDGNCDAMGLDASYETDHRLDFPYDPNRFTGKLIRFAGVDRVSLQGMTVRNPVSYGIQLADVSSFAVRDLYFDYNWHFGTTDGVHINGPARDGIIENLSGTTNDDLVGMTTYDEPHAEVSLGAIENICIRNVSAKNGYSAIRLLSGENYPMRAIHIDGIYGTYRHHAVVISNHNGRPGKVWFDDILIENVVASKSSTPLTEECHIKWEIYGEKDAFFYFGQDARCGNVTVRNVHRHQETGTKSPLFAFKSTAKIDRLLLDNILQTTAEGVEAPLWRQDAGAEIKELIQRNSVTEGELQ